ncbi:MAG TPA: twin-arginine translocase TatA/TatE family subunit [Nitrospira sp.]|nr:twin-arginine translocase TatA/TatE family subunit [Nitrospira sp.]
MFGTMGISELIIILVIVLIIFGAGKLPQIGEGVGKALKGFKKEVHDIPQPEPVQAEAVETVPPQVQAPIQQAQPAPPTPASPAAAAPKPTAPYTPGPELTPGTTAALMYKIAAQPQAPRPVAAQGAAPVLAADQGQRPPTMEERAAAPSPVTRAQYPPLPPSAQQKPQVKRPSAIVNKDAVARVQAQQAALKAKASQPGGGVSPADMQSLGEGLGDALRTFKQAVADVRNSVDPEMRTIQAEMDAAQKEIQQSIEAARELPAVQEETQKPA